MSSPEKSVRTISPNSKFEHPNVYWERFLGGTSKDAEHGQRRAEGFAYTKTVSIPVSKKHHQTQFPETPEVRTISVTKLGVSVEKVVATIDSPKSHHGMVRPERKNSVEFLPDFLET